MDLTVGIHASGELLVPPMDKTPMNKTTGGNNISGARDVWS